MLDFGNIDDNYLCRHGIKYYKHIIIKKQTVYENKIHLFTAGYHSNDYVVHVYFLWR